ncbi:energy transducer TonB [Neptunitalea lumnitzerae]|nr:energy transducer TonB [Neptunitalea sp. Y10]
MKNTFFVCFLCMLSGIVTKGNAQENATIAPVQLEQAYKLPMFADCKKAKDAKACLRKQLDEHTIKNFKYPAEARDNGIQGRIVTTLLFTKEGKIVIKAVKALGASNNLKILEDNTRAIFENLPDVQPAEDKDGNPIDVVLDYPIVYRLH